MALVPVRPAAALPSHPPRVVRAAGAGRVTIARDSWGIPHVSAGSVADLFFGQGFATAQDRLWQLEWDRRRRLGRAAELVGTPAVVASDAFCRRARLGDASRSGYAALDEVTREALDAHAAGVNAFLASTSARPIELQALEAEPEPWTGWHSVSVFLIRHVTFATWQAKLWRARLLAALGPAAVAQWRAEGAGDTPLIVPSGVREAVDRLASAGLFAEAGAASAAALAPLGLNLSGSNAWALDGRWTASGRPLVAGDPHRPLELPNVYYQVRLEGAGIDAAGFSFPGVPGIPHFGQSTTTAWAVTNASAEYQDLFVERFEEAAAAAAPAATAAGPTDDGAPGGGDETGAAGRAGAGAGSSVRYLVPGGVWADADVRRETIVVRDGAPVEVLCVATAHGPIVVGGPEHGVGVALASTGLDEPGGSLRCIVPQLRATTVETLDDALAGWVEPANNFLLADVGDGIAYRTGGRVPLRPEAGAWLPVPGWTGEFDWRGTIPDAELPREVRPDGGRIVTANQRVVGAAYPHLLGVDAAARNRADRIWARLGERRGLTVEDQAAIHRDSVSLPLSRVAALVVALDPAALTDAPMRSARAALEGWDGQMLADSVPAGIASAVRAQLVHIVAAGLPAELRENPFATWEPPATALPLVQRVAQMLDGAIQRDAPPPPVIADALRRAVIDLSSRFGTDESAWPWGAQHESRPAHPLRGLSAELDTHLDAATGPLSGDVDCVWATNSAPGVTERALTGSTARYVWDLADRGASTWIVPLGASGHPASPHWRDQQRAWTRGEMVAVEWEGAEVEVLIDPAEASLPEPDLTPGRGNQQRQRGETSEPIAAPFR